MTEARTRFATLRGDHSLSHHNWRVGEIFAFEMGGGGRAPRVVFLGEAGRFAGVEVVPSLPTLPKIASIFTDKMLYREGNDTVRVGVYAAAEARSTVRFELRLNGERVASPSVSLDENGLGIYELRDPVAGAYEVELAGSTTSFTVAAYKLAPLTGTLERSELSGAKGKEMLAFSVRLQTYGAPLVGLVGITLMDLGQSPPARRGELVLQADAEGRVSGSIALAGAGPFSLTAQVAGDAAKTASMPLPGTREADRDELELSAWNERTVARLVPFAGAALDRGVWARHDPLWASTPIELLHEAGAATVRLRADADAWHLVFLGADGKIASVKGAFTEAGTRIPVPAGRWSVVLAGVNALGRAWEGRAVVLGTPGPTVRVEAPLKAGPGERIDVVVHGPAGGSAWVLVRDQRLQSADTPLSTTAASLRRQLVAGLGLTTDGYVDRCLDRLLPEPKPVPPPVMAMPMRGGPGAWMAVPAPAPQGMPAPVGAPPPRAMAMAKGTFGGAMPEQHLAREGAAAPIDDAGPPVAATRASFPDVMLATIVALGPEGRAVVPVQLGDAMGAVAVDVFVAANGDWGAASAELQVTRAVFGELTLPRFVARGDFAEGILVVRVNEGSALVTVTCDGRPVSLHGSGEPAETAFVASPGATLRFSAAAGDWAAEVRAHDLVDRSEGRVEEPGRLVWLQRAIRMLTAGEELRAEGDILALRVLPSLDATFDKMVGGLRSYEHCCCEQTSAVLLAAAAGWLTTTSPDQKRAAAAHIRACVAREETMWLRGRGFKGWPEYPAEVFVFSPGATLNLLQVELLEGFPMDEDLAAAVKRCLEMARDAAKAHGIETAPSRPESAREAYGRFGKFVEDRQRMATFIRERIEPWEKEMEAILRFKVPGMSTESWNRSPAMIRAETAFGAATLIEAGGEHALRGLRLANTVLGAIQQNGSLYSTLDSVAAITLLSALRNAKMDLSGSRVRVDGVELTGGQAAAAEAPASHVLVVAGTAQVQVERLVTEDYTAIDQGVSAVVTLERDGRATTTLAPGDAVDLVVRLSSGYLAGDLVHVFLCDALSWVQGGGQVKKFSLDLRGQAEIRVPLAATGLTLDAEGKAAPQHFAVCIRNMYDERRGKGFGGLPVTVKVGGGSGLGGRIASGLRSLFGVGR